jgi:hypothetical protein
MQTHEMTGDSIDLNKAEELAAQGFEIYFRQNSGFWVRTDNLTIKRRTYAGYVTGEKATHLPFGAFPYPHIPAGTP